MSSTGPKNSSSLDEKLFGAAARRLPSRCPANTSTVTGTRSAGVTGVDVAHRRLARRLDVGREQLAERLAAARSGDRGFKLADPPPLIVEPVGVGSEHGDRAHLGASSGSTPVLRSSTIDSDAARRTGRDLRAGRRSRRAAARGVAERRRPARTPRAAGAPARRDRMRDVATVDRRPSTMAGRRSGRWPGISRSSPARADAHGETCARTSR